MLLYQIIIRPGMPAQEVYPPQNHGTGQRVLVVRVKGS